MLEFCGWSRILLSRAPSPQLADVSLWHPKESEATSLLQRATVRVLYSHAQHESPGWLAGWQIMKTIASTDRKALLGVGAFLGLFLLYIGLMTSTTIIVVLVGSLLMLWFAVFLAGWVLKKDEGPKEMQEVRVL